MSEKHQRIEALIQELLREIEPESYSRHGLQDTPKRVAKMYDEIFAGYGKTGKEVLAKNFEDDVINTYNGIVLVRNIPLWSQCEHHMVPFYGRVWVGYIRGDEQGVVGLSKMARLVEIYARRLQVQERLTEQITNDLEAYLKPRGVMVVMTAVHTCMCARGAKAHGTSTLTSSVRGTFLESAAARAEFMSAIQNEL